MREMVACDAITVAAVANATNGNQKIVDSPPSMLAAVRGMP